ncbi:pyridoxal phosphate-dependent decarboxylase family protein [Agromyces aerolatus]|uniref:pyridoxal phosphate-dependent decarboxylase family protein n=1 Tax=Agromyces sp. LY-1074 TaxID=3074080 RepID=UPI00285EFCE5|nr:MULTISPECIES: aminotransferase class V-fold PLP-dependent enzyme [unclassified Agromyces]MDR5698920.1 aminotransferase class V-fold PLP-dependent enzyme [Agromyces sp. LY-1074]MDR5705302.1 aminotransferase class V-fold PLP-dependent enzyme [Agromyces sp. LY-1358]
MNDATDGFRREASDILAELRELRAADAPTHGGRVLSYVYDSGLAELDELAADAARLVQPVNGLDPTTFTSVAALESRVVGFARTALGGDADVVGSVTSGGTESCLLAVKTARDAWVAAGGTGQPRLVAPVTAHAAFHKAAHYFGLALDLVPVDPVTGRPEAAEFAWRLGSDVALVVVSAPSYPFATLDSIAEVAALAAEAGIAVHVDACIGGFALAFWPEPLPPWDLRVPGVTSVSADLHKYGYAPKGVSVLLTRGRDRQRRQYFAITRWPGYPVVNPTMTGSKPAGPLAAAWAIIEALGVEGFRRLTARAAHATAALVAAVDGIEGLRVVGEPTGPLLAVASDERMPPGRRVDPHHWADAATAAGWRLQLQPGLRQKGGGPLPRTAHLTVTPVTDAVLDELVPALVRAADEVRGIPPVDGAVVLAALAGADGQLTDATGDVLGADLLGPGPAGAGLLGAGLSGAGLSGAAATLSADAAAELLRSFGLLASGGGALPAQLAPVLALMETLPPELAEPLLIELLARVVEPR